MTNLAWFVILAGAVAAMPVQVFIVWLVGTNRRVEAAQDAAADAELQEIVEAGR